MSRFALFCQTLAVCLAGSLCLAAALNTSESRRSEVDWPQWRGPHRDGISSDTGLNHNWGDKGPPLAWKASGLGGGFSSISISGGKIFTMGDRDKQQFVEAIDLNDRHPIWSTRISDAWRDQKYLGPRCTPTIDDGRAYAVGTYGDLVCLDIADGSVIWRKNFEQDFGGRMMSHWGFSESPLIDGEKVVCTPGGADAAMVALDKKTGAEIWRCKVPDLGANGKDGAAYSSIVVSEACGVRQYVQLMGRGVIGVDAANGNFLWGYNKIANRTANIPTPIPHGDYVFCSTGYQTGAALLKLNRSGGSEPPKSLDVEEVYFLSSDTLQNHHGGMVMIGDYLYGGTGHNNGFPICVEWKTGKVMWNGGRGPGTGSAAVVFADGYFYLRYQSGVVAQIKATPDGYQLAGTLEIPDVAKPSWPHPVIVGGKLYIREQDNLFCYDLK